MNRIDKELLITEIRARQEQQVKKGRFQFVASVEELRKLSGKQLKEVLNLVIANSI